MKDSYVLPQETAEDTSTQMGDWVVIRRKSAKPAPTLPAVEVEEAVLVDEADAIDATPAQPAGPRLKPMSEAELLGEAAPEAADTDLASDADILDEIPQEAMSLEAYELPPQAEEPEMAEDEDSLDWADPADEPDMETLMPEIAAEPRPMPLVLASAPEPQDDDAAAEELWAKLRPVSMGALVDGKPARRSKPSLIEYFRADPIAKGFDLLRTRLVRTIKAHGWRRIAVVSPTRHCGATFTAANLALSLSRVPGSRTVLMDMNQRNPGVSEALGVRNPGRLDLFLSAETAIEDYLVRVDDTLALGLADAPCDFAAEMLHDPLTSEVLEDMTEALNPDLVLYDLPPMLDHDDLAAFLPQVDGVLLVVDGTKTTPEHIAACERILEGQTQLLGVVLNRGRADKGMEIAV